ncbi:MAG: protein kinase, partial [Kiritimatiellae bacterium]|nr:protein kinase [Kiritimatiellia bacterium]
MKSVEELLAGRKAECRPAGGRLRLGEVVDGWRVEAYLGSGLSAEVYRVVGVKMGGEGALKLLTGDSGGLGARFEAEREAIRTLALPCLPRFCGAGTVAGRPYFVMEYLQPLFLPLDRGEVVRFVCALAAGVESLHAAGFLHRDLKPANVLRRRNGEPVLIDLGLVKRIGAADPGRAPAVSVVDGRRVGVGTPGFAAPEQLERGEASVRGDVYSLGMMLKACGGKSLGHAMRAVASRATSA